MFWLRSLNFTPLLFPGGGARQLVAQVAEGSRVFAGTGKDGDPPQKSDIVHLRRKDVPRYVPAGLAQPVSLTVSMFRPAPTR